MASLASLPLVKKDGSLLLAEGPTIPDGSMLLRMAPKETSPAKLWRILADLSRTTIASYVTKTPCPCCDTGSEFSPTKALLQ